MKEISIGKIVAIVVALAVGIALIVMWRKLPVPTKDDPAYKGKKRKRTLTLLGGVMGLWLACGLVIGLFAGESGKLHVEIFAPRVQLFGLSISSSVVIAWAAMALVIVAAVLVRVLVVPKFKDQATGVQMVLETAVGFVCDYTEEKSGVKSESLNAYMLTLALFLTSCAMIELFSFRPPTADIVMTLSLALCTFCIINYFGIKKKGVGGRILSFAHPTPIVFPFRILSDIATPVSLACRLFGNMLGGMIVMHMVYMALGSFGVGAPAVLGLYFNAFHPLIQVFIFITLSLTFIGEAVE